jgi:hypothetical protein
MKNFLNEGNQIHNFISSSGSGTVINYGSGSDFLTKYGSGSGSTGQKLRFLRFRFRFHNTVYNSAKKAAQKSTDSQEQEVPNGMLINVSFLQIFNKWIKLHQNLWNT